jgi:hypothetical protein
VISKPNRQPNDGTWMVYSIHLLIMLALLGFLPEDRCRLLTGQRGMLGIMTASSFSGSNLKMPKLLIRKSLLFSLGHYPFRCHD